MRLIILLTILLTLWSVAVFAQLQPAYTDEEIVNAIYKVENSEKYPYGIKSIDTKGDETYARQICFNSVRNARKRWEKAGKPEDLISYMGKRYSPPEQNPNWVRLVKYFLNKEQ